MSTELSVKSSTTKSENVFLHKNGEILDEQCRERRDVQEYSSQVGEEEEEEEEQCAAIPRQGCKIQKSIAEQQKPAKQ